MYIVVISKKKPGSGGGGGSSAKPGDKKYGAASNAKGTGTGNMARLDNETEELSHKKSGLALGKAIQQGRQKKGMTQAKLAQAINEKPQIVNTYENGKAIPNGAIIAKIEKQLGIKLPRPQKKKK